MQDLMPRRDSSQATSPATRTKSDGTTNSTDSMSAEIPSKRCHDARTSFDGSTAPFTTSAVFQDAAKTTDEAQSATWRALLAFVTQSHLPLLFAAITASVIAGATSPAQNFIVGRLYEYFTSYARNEITTGEFIRLETKYVLYQCAIAGGSWLFHSLEFMFWLAFGELQAKSARDRLYYGLLEKEIAWYDREKNGVGALLPRLQSQIRELQLADSQPLGSLFSLTSTALLSLVQAFVRSWDLTFVTLSTVPLIMALVVWCGNPMQKNLHKQQEKLLEAQKCSTSVISFIETVKCFNGQKIETQNYQTRVGAAAGWYALVANASAMQMGFVALLSMSLFVQGFYYGAILVAKGTINAGDVVATFFSAVNAFQAISSILPQMIVFEKGKAAGWTLRTVMAQIESSPRINRENFQVPTKCFGDIEVESLCFAYPSRPDQLAIKDVSLYIKGGELTFLIGKSGSGKSTIGQLLLRFYDSYQGSIKLDNMPLERLDTGWLRSNITLVEQTSSLFDDSIFRNIAFGRRDYNNVTKAEVLEAAEFALLRLMVTDMPKGVDTVVGFKGSSLSGGQRQRVALARARLRDTPILILDESTSALDYVNRTLMMDAIRRWREGKTTVIITHDISQILARDYVYLLQDGRIVEEGYRKQLEQNEGSPFQAFIKEEGEALSPPSDHYKTDLFGGPGQAQTMPWNSRTQILHTSASNSELSSPGTQFTVNKEGVLKRRSDFPSTIQKDSSLFGTQADGGSSWMHTANRPLGESPPGLALTRDLLAGYASPTLLPLPLYSSSPSMRWSQALSDLVNQTGKRAVTARQHQPGSQHQRRATDDSMAIPLTARADSLASVATKEKETVPLNSMRYIAGTLWPSLSCMPRVYLIAGFWGATVHAICIPAFSYILSKLMETYNEPGGNKPKALMYSMIILGLSIADATHCWAYRFFHEYTSQLWVDRVRCEAFERILDQSKSFFEKPENGLSRLTGTLDRDAEEMRNILGRFASLVYVAMLMIVISIIWSLVAQWKLTLIALTAGPYVFVVTKAFANISEKWEGHSNDAAESAAAIFTETFSNIKTVRALTLESYFRDVYVRATNHALRVGLQRSFYAGFFYGVSNSAGNFSIAMIFYVGAKLVATGAPVSAVVQVFIMLIFLIGNVSGILEFIPQLGASKDSAARLLRLAALPRTSHEHLGDARIASVGDVVFDRLRFAYPSRPEQTILRDFSLRLRPGTITAIVGGSGSGKSTIASLLVDMYSASSSSDPGRSGGGLSFGGRDITRIHTPTLRTLVVPVSQFPTVFADSVADNLAYGLSSGSPLRAPAHLRRAATQAGLHDFIASLPQGYDTLVGDGNTGLSGGQAQRLALARALLRRPAILVLDEATSALDPTSAALVRRTIRGFVGSSGDGSVDPTLSPPTTTTASSPPPPPPPPPVSPAVVIITHDREMMALAQRVVVLDHGRVVEQGGFAELAARKHGALANLLRAGEWVGAEESGEDTAQMSRSLGTGGPMSLGREGELDTLSPPPALGEVDWRGGERRRGVREFTRSGIREGKGRRKVCE